jgi:RHS repeat-associated protein
MKFKTLAALVMVAFIATSANSQQLSKPLTAFLQNDTTDYLLFKRTWHKYIAAAAVNRQTKTYYLITTHGELFDSVKVSDDDFGLMEKKEATPFQHYEAVCNEILGIVDAAKQELRKKEFLDFKQKENNLLASYIPQLKKVINPLQKLSLLDRFAEPYITDKMFLSFGIVLEMAGYTERLYEEKDYLRDAGKIIATEDSVSFFNQNIATAAYKAVLIKSKAKLYYFFKDNTLIDSVSLNKTKIPVLLKEKADVFLIYHSYLEMQKQLLEEKINETDSVLQQQKARTIALQVSNKTEKIKELLNLLTAELQNVNNKIDLVTKPEYKAVESIYYYTYKDIDVNEALVTSMGGIVGRYITTTRGNKKYELTDHRGNVMVTVSDKKRGKDINSDGTVDYYIPYVVTAQDYSSFGATMPGRKFSTINNYRYGYNGKEEDDEVKGDGNQQDYGFRIYDPRIARFLSVDPLTKSYPMLTPYQYSSNRPIDGIDRDGLEYGFEWRLTFWIIKAKLGISNSDGIQKQISEHTQASNNNYGQFDETKDIGEQVRDNQKKALETKVNIVTTYTKAGVTASAIVLTPYAISAGVVVLPELFAVGAGTQISSYLTQSTVSAFFDATSQKIITGKVDWADVASNYLPLKGKLGAVVSGGIQAAFDYQDGNFKTVFDTKSVSESSIDALTAAFVNKLFGRYNKAIEKAFEAKGLKPDQVREGIVSVIKSQTEFIQGLIKTTISEKAKEKTNSKTND